MQAWPHVKMVIHKEPSEPWDWKSSAVRRGRRLSTCVDEQ